MNERTRADLYVAHHRHLNGENIFLFVTEPGEKIEPKEVAKALLVDLSSEEKFSITRIGETFVYFPEVRLIGKYEAET